MNVFQKILGIIFPPYKFAVLRREQGQLFTAIISVLPESMASIKEVALSGKFFGFSEWKEYPDFKFCEVSYSQTQWTSGNKRGENFKILGFQLYSSRTNQFEDIEILVKNNLVNGLKITNSEYYLSEFGTLKFKSDSIHKLDFQFMPEKIDLFYNSLDLNIKQRIMPSDLFEIEFNGRVYYAFNDLEDGNYLAVNERLEVYSLVHDSKPMAKKQNVSFDKILSDLQTNKFDKQHFKDRYLG
ncbi:hypothetical protein ACFP1I_13165 [Dyadobacter subterraneus]|uniref:Uncharacterized protein n=1 Tax=Dyadobacter subterraneus TaxID=2773304 RepID=A0ABR9W9R5_9BACT|nr:hypothetical protein [Dyadobacter subterraneus]MBE9462182.1 hypothetical protein [Dyadobacter subterraneus]